MNYQDKNTKIVATISDLRCEPEFILELYKHGMNVVRLNTAHQNHEGTKKVIENVRKVSDKIPIMLDTKGPEVRTILDETLNLKEGDTITIGNGGTINVSYEQFAQDVPVGSQILVNDGQIQFTVLEVKDNLLHCRVDNSSEIKNKKSVNVPGVHLDMPSLTEKDINFIKFAAEQKLDFVAHSFVRNKEDCIAVQNILDEMNSPMKIIAKIENREGVDNIEEILDHVHGVMVARGDLGIEVPASEVPLIQKKLIESCVMRAKPVIVATHMLESMIENPRATRAEINDIANAILDGTSAIMLSSETAQGKYPIEAVRTMSEVAMHLRDEKLKTNPFGIEPKEKSIRGHLAKSAVELAISLNAKAIVVPSMTGGTVRVISAMRSRKPIFAPCYDENAMRQLALSHGVRVSKLQVYDSTDNMVHGCVSELVKNGELVPEDTIVIVAGTPSSEKHKSNFLEIATVKDILTEYEK